MEFLKRAHVGPALSALRESSRSFPARSELPAGSCPDEADLAPCPLAQRQGLAVFSLESFWRAFLEASKPRD